MTKLNWDRVSTEGRISRHGSEWPGPESFEMPLNVDEATVPAAKPIDQQEAFWKGKMKALRRSSNKVQSKPRMELLLLIAKAEAAVKAGNLDEAMKISSQFRNSCLHLRSDPNWNKREG